MRDNFCLGNYEIASLNLSRRWVKTPSAAFQGHSALEVMLGGEMTDLKRVRLSVN
jgi:Protein of unknown function (DUF2384)